MILLDQAKKAFPLHPIPVKVLSDEKDLSEFSCEILNRFQGKSWDVLSLDDWINIGVIETIKNYTLPKSFHYYVPSILLLSLSSDNYIDWGLKAIVPDNQSRSPKGEWWLEYFACFSDDKKKFVQEYVLSVLEKISECSEEEYLAQIALEEIWL